MGQRNGEFRISRRSPAEWLIQRAARHAPADLRDRLEEEWSADMSSRNSEFSRFSFALGCCWAIRVIAFEQLPLVPATHSAIGTKFMNAYAQHNVGFYSRRTMSFFMVVGAHVAVFAALMLTISTTKITPPSGPIIAKYIDVTRPRDVPKVPTVKTNINIQLPINEVDLPRISVVPDTTIIGELRPLPIVDSQPPQPPGHVARLEQGGTGVGFPDPAGFYPEQSIRLGDQGVSVVKVCVNTKGRLTGEPITARTSGFERLDLAAIKLAKAGSGHYRPATEDGMPIESCYPVGVRFQIRN